jgi:hypothetical protein
VEGSAVVSRQPIFRTNTALPFVISTGAQRSAEICGSLARLQTLNHIRFDDVVAFEAHSFFDDP